MNNQTSDTTSEPVAASSNAAEKKQILRNVAKFYVTFLAPALLCALFGKFVSPSVYAGLVCVPFATLFAVSLPIFTLLWLVFVPIPGTILTRVVIAIIGGFVLLVLLELTIIYLLPGLGEALDSPACQELTYGPLVL